MDCLFSKIKKIMDEEENISRTNNTKVWSFQCNFKCPSMITC